MSASISNFLSYIICFIWYINTVPSSDPLIKYYLSCDKAKHVTGAECADISKYSGTLNFTYGFGYPWIKTYSNE